MRLPSPRSSDRPLVRPARRAGALAAAGAALALSLAPGAQAAEKVTPDVSGTQRVLAVGCRFADTIAPGILDAANPGIDSVLAHTHDFFDQVSDGRVDFEGTFAGWHTLPKSTNDYPDDSDTQQVADCQQIANQVLTDRGEKASDYRAVALLFNSDRGVSNAEWQEGDHRWIKLRFTGGVGGGWTSEAAWAHEMGHAFGLLHSTFPTRAPGNQYNDFQDTMSGFGHSPQHRWNFPAGGVCNGIVFTHPRCIYAGEADNVPVHYSAFQKQRVGWLDPDQVATHWGGRASYQLSAPTYNPTKQPTAERLKMVEVKLPDTTAYYAIEYRRGANDGAESDQSAYRRGWDSRELGIASDRVTVYLVEPDLYAANAGDLGDANLVAVLHPGEAYTPNANSTPYSNFTVTFDSVEPGPHMNGYVTVQTPPTPPPSSIFVGQAQDGSWANGDVTGRLFNAHVPGDGVPIARMYYGVDDPGCNTQTRDCSVYNGAFTISSEGQHDVTWFAVDAAGTVEDQHHATVRIDRTAPTTTASLATAGGPTQVTLAASDALSGVAETDYDLDGAGFKPYTGPVVVSTPGDHTFRFRSVDKAGNFEAPQSTTVHVAPLPLSCAATASPGSIKPADGRMVPVKVTLRCSDTAAKVVLRKVERSGAGSAVAGWQTGSADTRGRVKAARGARYVLHYTVKDAAGQTATADATVKVAG